MKRPPSENGNTLSAGTSGGPIAMLLRFVLMAASAMMPLFIAPTDIDAFRLPKTLLYEAFAAICAALLATLFLYRSAEVLSLLRKRLPAVSVAAAALAWTAVTTFTSTNRELSMRSLIWVALTVSMFVATLVAAHRGRGVMIIVASLLAAAVNATLAILQSAAIYNPMVFAPAIPTRVKTTGLIGNPNDVGTYLLFPALVAVVLAVVSRGRIRTVAFAVIALLLTAGLVATATLTAIFAFACAAVVLVALRTRRYVISFSIVAVTAIVLFGSLAPLRQRVADLVSQVRSAEYVQLLSLRMPAFVAAVEMFKDRPLVGVGPGCFHWWYLPYKLELNSRYPTFYASTLNFGEVHNDHLQTLAVSGMPGYLIFLAALVILARLSLRKSDRGADENPDDRRAFSQLCSLPMAVAFAVVTLAQFPLELASTTSVIIPVAAVCVAWSDQCRL